jgi:hypothetical protein
MISLCLNKIKQIKEDTYDNNHQEQNINGKSTSCLLNEDIIYNTTEYFKKYREPKFKQTARKHTMRLSAYGLRPRKYLFLKAKTKENERKNKISKFTANARNSRSKTKKQVIKT